MAASWALSASSYVFSNSMIPSITKFPPLPHTLPVKGLTFATHEFSRAKIGVLVVYNKRELISTSSSAVATDSSSETAIVADESKSPDDSFKKISLPTNDSSQKLLKIRHTCAHIMAMAVQKLFPNAKATIGPWIETGFYYDFDMEPLADKDLKRIKKEMAMEFVDYRL